MHKSIPFFSALVMALACLSMPQSASARYYEHCDNCGTVRSIERISHRDRHYGGGTVVGALVGGALGNTVGKGNGRTAATVVGAVAGGAVGHHVEERHR